MFILDNISWIGGLDFAFPQVLTSPTSIWKCPLCSFLVTKFMGSCSFTRRCVDFDKQFEV